MPRVYIRYITRSTMYQKSTMFLARTGVWKLVLYHVDSALLKSIILILLKCLISRINEVYVYFNKISLYILLKNNFIYNRLFCCNHTCYCVNMVSVTSASSYIASASRYHPRYQSRSSMYIRSLIPRNWPKQFQLLSTCT